MAGQTGALSKIPRDQDFPEDSVQCDACGGLGTGYGDVPCVVCEGRGWLTPKTHPQGRRCERPGCGNPLPPKHIAVYCSNECAWLDA
jgi:hypothetical protein